MSTRKQLLTVFDRMESERQALFDQLKGLSEETLTKKPEPGAWSVTEVMYHLKVAEESSLNYLRKKLEFGGHAETTVNSSFKLMLLNTAIALPIKYKAPKVAQVPEGAGKTFREALGEWDEIRAALRNEYESIDEKLIGHGLFKHPSAGKLNLVQGVRFMHQHMKRHFRQIERTLKVVV